jgi:hypothetical protein
MRPHDKTKDFVICIPIDSMSLMVPHVLLDPPTLQVVTQSGLSSCCAGNSYASQLRNFWTGGMAQMVEHLPSKHVALNSDSSVQNK